MINGDRVKQARELFGLTQTDLAERVGVSQPAISDIEVGRIQGSAETVGKIASATGFPMGFFELEGPTNFPLGSLLFRSRAVLTSQQMSKAHRHSQLVFELVERMAERANIPGIRVPVYVEDPVAAAALTRAT